MTASIPNGFSSEDLQEMLANAQPDAESLPEQFRDRVEALAIKGLDNITESCEEYGMEADCALVHKVAACMILSKLIEWHTHVGNSHFEKEETTSGVCWLRDAGKVQAALSILMEVALGDDDFTIQ